MAVKQPSTRRVPRAAAASRRAPGWRTRFRRPTPRVSAAPSRRLGRRPRRRALPMRRARRGCPNPCTVTRNARAPCWPRWPRRAAPNTHGRCATGARWGGGRGAHAGGPAARQPVWVRNPTDGRAQTRVRCVVENVKGPPGGGVTRVRCMVENVKGLLAARRAARDRQRVRGRRGAPRGQGRWVRGARQSRGRARASAAPPRRAEVRDFPYVGFRTQSQR